MLRLLVRVVFAVVVVAVGGATLGGFAWTRMHEPFKGFPGEELFVEIPPGAGTAAIRRRLIDAGVVRDELAFRAALWWTGAARRLQAGEYRFDAPLTALDVVEKLARGDVYARRITFPEGLTIGEMARIVDDGGFGSAEGFLAAAGDVSLIGDLDPEATDLEGYLFPDTYAFARRTPVSQIVAAMVDRFRGAWDEACRRHPEPTGLTPRQVVTLASLVEKETAQPAERALVSAVYHNRLRIGMAMQADPTVVYALTRARRYDGNIRKEDLQFNSPYNTYRYRGLPPGPIASPGQASLEAALAPADAPHLYFVSRNDGSHVFADTLAQHNANVRTYQVLYFRSDRSNRSSRSTDR